MQTYLQTILNWRKDQAVIHSGKMIHFVPQDGMYVYFRCNQTETVMVILNKNREAKNLSTSRFSEVTGRFKAGKEIISSTFLDDLKNITVPARSAMIIELN